MIGSQVVATVLLPPETISDSTRPAHRHARPCYILPTLSAFPPPVAECGCRATDDWKGTRMVAHLRHLPFVAKSGYSLADRSQLAPYKAIQSHRLVTRVCDYMA